MSESQTGVTVTLKAGAGFESPWIVIHAESVADAKNQIDTGDFAALAERTVAAAEFFRAAHNVKGGLASNEAQAPPAQQPQQAGPSWSQQGSQQQAPAPGGDRQCIHGAREYKDFTSKAGKHIKMWACTARHLPREQQCAPEWVK